MTTPAEGNPRRERLEDELAQAYREADKILVSVASGVLALSVALVGNIKQPIDTWAIRLSWVFMFLTVVCVLASLVCERIDKRWRIENIYAGNREIDTPFTKVSIQLNRASIATFILGLAAIGWFLWVNTN